MEALPKVTLTLRLTDPEWTPMIGENDRITNMDDWAKAFVVEVEVVQLNLNTGGMRVRFPWPNKNVKSGVSMQSVDVGIQAFFDKYSRVEK